MTPVNVVAFASYGNDSVALVQWLHEACLPNVVVLYSDTGWSKGDWAERVLRMEDWVRGLGFRAERTASVGLEQLVRDRKGWPRQGMQFCTIELKMEPAMRWLDANDPQRHAACCVGVRREESNNRRHFPEVLDVSPNHGGRTCWAPLVDFTTAERDALIRRAGVEPLPHRSMECFPCVNSNRADLRMLANDPARIDEIERIEDSLGFTSKGKPRTMFRPYRHMGASGIREVVRWAIGEPGAYQPEEKIDDCETGFCGL